MKVKPNTRRSSHTASPRAPRRRRGELRVAALLDSAVETFAEKGYAAATMTEIAARAGAAIGSLYQFFPSKEALAGALLNRYATLMEANLTELVKQARRLTPRGLADALIARRLEQRREREAVLAVTESPGTAGERARFNETIQRHFALAVKAVNPALPAPRCRVMAGIILQVLRQAPVMLEGDPRQRPAIIRELRELLALYIAGG